MDDSLDLTESCLNIKSIGSMVIEKGGQNYVILVKSGIKFGIILCVVL